MAAPAWTRSPPAAASASSTGRAGSASCGRSCRRLTGLPVIHLCFPWHVSGPTARRLAKDAGYRTAFCGKVAGVPVTLAGGDLSAIARIGEDYVELLPGRGRTTLTAVLQQKWRRRRRSTS